MDFKSFIGYLTILVNTLLLALSLIVFFIIVILKYAFDNQAKIEASESGFKLFIQWVKKINRKESLRVLKALFTK